MSPLTNLHRDLVPWHPVYHKDRYSVPCLFLFTLVTFLTIYNPTVRMFADDCVIYRKTTNLSDYHKLHDDLDIQQVHQMANAA